MPRSLLLLVALLAAAPAVSAADAAFATPEAAVSALWRALSHAPGAAADAATLERLFHEDAVIFGSRSRDGRPRLTRQSVQAFLAGLRTPKPHGFHECEVEREVRTHDRFASVYSVVESRRERTSAAADFTGVNGLQLHRDEAGWRIVALHYHLPPDGQAVPLERGRAGECLP